MIPLAQFLELSADDREDKFPYIWAVNTKNRLIRVVPAAPIVRSCEDRRNFWRMLKSLAGVREKVEAPDLDRIRAEVAQGLVGRLLEMAGGVAPVAAAAVPAIAAAPAPVNSDYTAPWIESAQCTSCDECIGINPKIFAYDDHKHAFVKNPKGGPYKDLVRAAEKCTAQVIHPGTPFDPNEKDVDKLLKRAAKYN
jgi:pyruvate-ferredoxin/flavodoxin oxidoreductase